MTVLSKTCVHVPVNRIKISMIPINRRKKKKKEKDTSDSLYASDRLISPVVFVLPINQCNHDIIEKS